MSKSTRKPALESQGVQSGIFDDLRIKHKGWERTVECYSSTDWIIKSPKSP